MRYPVEIQAILQKKSIIDYLQKKGFSPARSMPGGKYAYYCPLPDHEDKKSPSFVVWTNAEYENFHCFGCQRGYSIIHLMSFLEGISFRESLKRIADDLDISLHDNVSFSLEHIEKMLNSPSSMHYESLDIPQNLLSISSLCRQYLCSVNFADSECCIMDQFWSRLDKEILGFEFDAIAQTLRELPEVLQKRREKFEEIQYEEQRQQYANRSNY